MCGISGLYPLFWPLSRRAAPGTYHGAATAVSICAAVAPSRRPRRTARRIPEPRAAPPRRPAAPPSLAVTSQNLHCPLRHQHSGAGGFPGLNSREQSGDSVPRVDKAHTPIRESGRGSRGKTHAQTVPCEFCASAQLKKMETKPRYILRQDFIN